MINLTFSLIIIFISWKLFSRVAGSLNPTKLNLISWIFYYQLVIQCLIGSILIINGWNSEHPTAGLSNKAVLYGWMSVHYTMIALPLGMIFILFLFGIRSNKMLFEHYISTPIVLDKLHIAMKVPLYFLSLVSLFSVFYVYSKLPHISFLLPFRNPDTLFLAQYRHEVAWYFKGSTTLKNYFGILLTPTLSYIAYVYWIKSKRTGDLLWFLVMLIASFMILIYDLQKSTLITYFIGFMFITVLLKGRIKSIALLLGGAMALIMLTFFYTILTHPENYTFLMRVALLRILLGQVSGTFFAYDFFPNTYDHLGFTSFMTFYRQLFGLKTSENAARLIIETQDIILGNMHDTSGYANSLFIHEAWANFGLIGVILSPVYVGMYLQVLFIFFLRSKKTPIMVGLLGYLSTKITITNGFNEYMLSEPLLFLFIIFFFVYISGAMLYKGVTFRECENISS